MNGKTIAIHIHSLHGGGAERVTTHLASYLASQGHSVTLITTEDSKSDFYSLDTRVRRVSLGRVKSQWKYSRKFAELLRRLRTLRRTIRDTKPDVVLGVMTVNLLMVIIATVGLPVAVIGSERNYPGLKRLGFHYALLRRLLYRFSTLHIAQTDETAAWLRRHCGIERLTVIPNAVVWPLSSGPPVLLPQHLVQQEKCIILAVGSFSMQKGFDLLVEAFSEISDNLPNAVLVIVGGPGMKDRTGDQKTRIEELVARHNLADKVLMPGPVGNISDWYARADIFVLSSRYEGFPNVLLEAMAAGCAAVSFNCKTGPSEIIEHRRNGLLVPVENISSLAEAILDLATNTGLRSELSNAAKGVRDVYSQERIMKRWEQAIELAAEHSRANGSNA